MQKALLIVGVALTLAVSANIAQGIIFADGSMQSTAAPRGIEPGSEHSELFEIFDTASLWDPASTAVPAGKELVILQIRYLPSSPSIGIDLARGNGATFEKFAWLQAPHSKITSAIANLELIYHSDSGINDFPDETNNLIIIR